MAASLTKAVILARGLGTRMRRPDSSARESNPAADAGIKALVAVGRPLLDYQLAALVDVGVRDVILVIGPEHEAIRDHCQNLAPSRLKIRFATQDQPRGTADALLAAEFAVNHAEFLVFNSDNYYPADVLRKLTILSEPGTVLFEEHSLVEKSNIPAERVRAFAYGTINRSGYLTDLVEKPDADTAAALKSQALVSMNCWRFSTAIFEYCRKVKLSVRGELELPQAVRDAIHAGMKLRVQVSAEGVLDLSSRADIAEVAKRLRDVKVEL